MSNSASDVASLVLTSDAKGGTFDAIVPLSLTAGRDMKSLLDNKLIRGTSYAFSIDDPADAKMTRDKDKNWVRTVSKIGALYDITATTGFPAYP